MQALIIGGATGFGKEISTALKNAGYTVISTGRRQADLLADVGSEQEWKEVLERLSKERAFSVIVCVVGYARAKQEGHDVASWDEHEQKNVGYVRQALEILPYETHARIATIGSQWSWKRGAEELAPYIETKHALRRFTEEFAEAHPELSVSHLCPPTMQTAQLEKVLEGGYARLPAVVADSALIAEAMVRELLTKDFHGETVQFTPEGESHIIQQEDIQTEPRYPRPAKK